MAWDGTKTCDECYSEPAFADDMRETAILEVCLFKFLATGTTTVLEGASRADMGRLLSIRIMHKESRTSSSPTRQEMCQLQRSQSLSKDPRRCHTGWRQSHDRRAAGLDREQVVEQNKSVNVTDRRERYDK
jgi:hypothetical protein